MHSNLVYFITLQELLRSLAAGIAAGMTHLLSQGVIHWYGKGLGLASVQVYIYIYIYSCFIGWRNSFFTIIFALTLSDLAARNVLLDDHLTPKLCNFGPKGMRFFFQLDSGSAFHPARWLAPDCVFGNQPFWYGCYYIRREK